jgi:hypothetical protein
MIGLNTSGGVQRRITGLAGTTAAGRAGRFLGFGGAATAFFGGGGGG